MPLQSGLKTGTLRRTCEACAAVKVKCSNEKPEFSRCQHRGITCQYFIEKREANSAAASSLSPYSFSPPRTSKMSDERGAETITASVTSTPSHAVTNMITNCDDYFESAHLSQNFMSRGLFNNDTAAMDILGFFLSSTVSKLYQTYSHDIDSHLMPIKETTGFDLISGSTSLEFSARFSSTDHSTASLAAMSTGGTSPEDIPETITCQWLDQDLQLLKRVVSPMPSTTLDGNQPSAVFSMTETQPRRLEATLSENRQCLGAMDNILAGSAIGEDGTLPIILCMILLRILDRCSTVAWNQPPPSHSDIAELGSNMSGYLIMETSLVASTILTTSFDRGTSQHSNDEYFGRATAHLILGELHWVQRVLNQLSCDRESRQQMIPLPIEEPADPGLTSSFSAGTLEHMATDVQNRLTMFSTSIID
ncbi:hypothetical protein V8C34DRAFT_327020 [Trichoderma compactum]